MKVVVTGRIFNGRYLEGYRLCLIADDNTLSFVNIHKSELKAVYADHTFLNCELIRGSYLSSTLEFILISDYPRYLENGCRQSLNKHTDSSIIAATLNVDEEDIRYQVCDALTQSIIRGNIVYSEKAQTTAELCYNEIRKMTSDIKNISNKTGYSIGDIARVKHYLFQAPDINFNSNTYKGTVINDTIRAMNRKMELLLHNSDTTYESLKPDFAIAHSWTGLMTPGNVIEPHDIILLSWVLKEIILIEQGKSYKEAHEQASQEYNYDEGSRQYYEKFKSLFNF